MLYRAKRRVHKSHSQPRASIIIYVPAPGDAMGSRDFHPSPFQITESLTWGGCYIALCQPFTCGKKPSILVWQDLAIWMSLLDLFLGLRLVSQSSWLNAFVSRVPFYIASLFLFKIYLPTYLSLLEIFPPLFSHRFFVPCVISVLSESLFCVCVGHYLSFCSLYSGLWQPSTVG